MDYGRKSSEQGNVKFRRSLYFTKDMKVGEEITQESVRSVRPGYGLPPRFLSQVIGRKVKVNVNAATPVSWSDID